MTKKYFSKLLSASSILLCTQISHLPSLQAQSNLSLWYQQPSGNTWENALPIGNGFLGAMYYGNVQDDILQLNEATVWSGSPYENYNPLAKDSLAEMRKLIFDGQYKAAEKLANKVILTPNSSGQMFLPVANLHFKFSNALKSNDYKRKLDISQAIASTDFESNGIHYHREVFASIPNRVIVMRLTADKPKSISLESYFTTTEPNAKPYTTGQNELTIAGTTINHEGIPGKVKFKGIVHYDTQGGTLTKNDTSIFVKDADALTITISIATNYKNYKELSIDENEKANHFLQKALQKQYAILKKEQISAYQKYYNRVSLDLGQSKNDAIPTDIRLKNFHKKFDPQLVSLYYQYGRYLMISGSQPGGQPLTLQGLWNWNMEPAWDSKYTININTEMNYWPAEKTNLSELASPLFDMIKDMSETGTETARKMYNAKGWMAHHNTDLWRATGAVDGAFWGLWPNGGGWLSQHLWYHYLYTGDKAFLKKYYPILKGAAAFYNSYLIPEPTHHWMVVSPDESPENAPAAHQGSSLAAGTTMTNQIVFDVFSNAIDAAKILGIDKNFADSLTKMRAQLPPMQIGKYGQLQEWMDDVDDPKSDHRHISHLYGLYPSNQISPLENPQLSEAANNTLLQRGDVSTGWSMGWKVNWWARMHNGNHAYKLIKDQLTPIGTNKSGGGTYNNLFDAHPPFQIDGNFGCTSGITEMLLQSAYGCVDILPALPTDWKFGTVRGLKAQGGFEIKALVWKDGKVSKIVIVSQLGGNLRLRSTTALRGAKGNLIVAKGDNPNSFYQTPSIKTPLIHTNDAKDYQIEQAHLYDIPTEKGKEYIFYNIN